MVGVELARHFRNRVSIKTGLGLVLTGSLGSLGHTGRHVVMSAQLFSRRFFFFFFWFFSPLVVFAGIFFLSVDFSPGDSSC